MYYFLAYAVGVILGLYLGGALVLKVVVYVLQRHFLAQGMNWDAVDRHVEDMLDTTRLRHGPPPWKWKSEDARSRAKWEAYKANRENSE